MDIYSNLLCSWVPEGSGFNYGNWSIPDRSSFQKGEPDLHEEDDDAVDDQEEGVGVDHQRLQTGVDLTQRRFIWRHRRRRLDGHYVDVVVVGHVLKFCEILLSCEIEKRCKSAGRLTFDLFPVENQNLFSWFYTCY